MEYSKIFNRARPTGRLVAASLVALVWLSIPGEAAAAASCGDDVGGRRVACACGDVVVSDTRLAPGDPIVTERCERDGLIVRAPAQAAGIVVDLAGLTLRGSGEGVGIRVVRGGASGLTLIGGSGPRAAVTGFRTGLRAHGRRSVRAVTGISFSDNEGDGIRLHAVAAELRGVVVDDNGRDGARVRAHGAHIDDLAADDNGGVGLHVTGRNVDVGRVRLDPGARAAGDPRATEGGSR